MTTNNYEIVHEGSDSGIIMNFEDAMQQAHEMADYYAQTEGFMPAVTVKSDIIGYEDDPHSYFGEIKRTPIYGDCIFIDDERFAEPSSE